MIKKLPRSLLFFLILLLILGFYFSIQRDPNDNWKTYVNKERGFSFKYPNDWKVTSPGHPFGENNPKSKYYSITYAVLTNKENTTYDIKPDVVIVRIGEFSKTNSFEEKWENLTDREFYDTQGPYWKKGLDSHSVYGYTYSYPSLTEIANKKAIAQVYHPTEYYESATPDQITYNYVLLIDNNVFSILFKINDKNPQKEEMIKIRDQILSTFKFTK